MNWFDALAYFGIDPPSALAGLLGGVVKSLISRRDQPGELVTTSILGMIVANYVGPLGATYFDVKLGKLPGCFVVGITAIFVCQFLIGKAKTLGTKEPQP